MEPSHTQRSWRKKGRRRFSRASDPKERRRTHRVRPVRLSEALARRLGRSVEPEEDRASDGTLTLFTKSSYNKKRRTLRNIGHWANSSHGSMGSREVPRGLNGVRLSLMGSVRPVWQQAHLSAIDRCQRSANITKNLIVEGHWTLT
jgi:hypothetical protein